MLIWPLRLYALWINNFCVENMNAYTISLIGIGMDQMEFEGDTIQRVYQYLRRHAAGQDLDHFSFSDRVEGNVQDCLKIILA